MLRFSQTHYNEIRRHAEESYPQESCGILLGMAASDVRTVGDVLRCTNASPDPQTHYDIAPRELIRAQRHARDCGLDIIGFYHSHPDHPAHWSPTDLEHAHWIGCSYVITAVDNGKATRTNSFLLQGTVEEDKAFVEEQAMVEPEP